jgi:hypothetical protein
MNFEDTGQFPWIMFDGQSDQNVSYIFVASTPITRLAGVSDILYVGKTEQPISKRYKQETNTKNSPKNTQQTNIRMTHIFSKIGLGTCKCFYVQDLDMVLDSTTAEIFIENLKTWDKQFYLKNVQEQGAGSITIPVEKYLLVNYAAEHLELPPLNNRM